MSNGLAPKPRYQSQFCHDGDTIPIVARKLLRTQMYLHCLFESRIDTSHLSVQSEQPPN